MLKGKQLSTTGDMIISFICKSYSIVGFYLPMMAVKLIFTKYHKKFSPQIGIKETIAK